MEAYRKGPVLCCIIATLSAVSRKNLKGYCFPSQASVVSLLGRFYSLRVCRSSLNVYLSILEAHGYIRRIKRLKRLPSGALRFASTIYILTNKAYKLLYRFGCSLHRAGVRVFTRAKKVLARAAAPNHLKWRYPPGEIPSSLGEILRPKSA